MHSLTSTLTPVANSVCYPVSEVVTQIVTGLILILLYIICFAIGVKNIQMILIKQNLYKSIYMTLLYVFGELVCFCRFVSYTLFGVYMANILHKFCWNQEQRL